MSYLEFRNVCKDYNDADRGVFRAVKNSNINVEKGELVVFVGPSGCGKSTSLRMLAGLEEISSGEIIIDGQVVNDIPPKDRDISMVFQDYALYPHMKVSENLSFGLKNKKIDKNIIEERVKNSAEMLELTDVLERLPKALSGGQRQRVALGRALVRKPKIFLLDEPLSNLDAKLRVNTRKQIAQLHKELNATMIYVTHDQIEAMTLGDKIVVMNKGEIQQIADPQTLYNHPVNTFVAGFIGTPAMNLLNGKVVSEDKILIGEYEVAVPKEYKDKIVELVSKEVIVGVRPEHIYVEEVKEEKNLLNCNLVEFLGSENLLYFTVDGQEFICKVNCQYKMKENNNYKVSFQEEKVHLFDSETGIRL